MTGRRRFFERTDGVAAIEFSMVAPLFLLALLGGAEYGRALAISRRVELTVRTVTDLATQVTQLKATDDTTILNASAQVMSPYGTTSLTIVMSEVFYDPFQGTKVVWSRALNTTALNAGSSIALPLGSVLPGNYVIYGQVAYSYTPVIGGTIIAPFTMSGQIVMSPRKSASVDQV